MGYLVDGAFLAACIGAYRVYTDRRKSAMSSEWDNYRLFWINVSRHSVDFAASTFFNFATAYPAPVSNLMNTVREYVPSTGPILNRFHQDVLHRSGRYRVWVKYGHLSYLQRVVPFVESENSLFGPCHPWKNNLLYTIPHFAAYVKDGSTRGYIESLCNTRDGFVGIFEGSPSRILNYANDLKLRRKDIVQDIRKGHVLDRKSESSASIVHALRMEVESFLFGVSGPDPDRSSYIEKSLNDSSEGLLERLFPFLEVIVDTEGESLTGATRGALKGIAPDIDVFVPFLRLGGEIVAVGLGDGEFIVCPLNGAILYDGKPERDGIVEGAVVKISHAESPNAAISGKVTGRHGEAIKIVIQA